jgi:hypothetical protein
MADDPAEPPKSPLAPQPLGDVGTNQQVLQNPLDDRRRRFAEMVSGTVEPPLPLRAEAGFSDGKVRVVELVTAENAQPISLEPVNLEVKMPDLGTPALTDVSRASTAIGRAVLLNSQTLQLVAMTFRAALDDAIEQLKEKRLNEDDAHARIDELEDLKRRVETFLGVASAFTADKGDEKAVVAARFSFMGGLRNIWEKRHLQIADWTMITSGATILCLTGPVPAIIMGTVVGGPRVAEVLKAFFESLKGSKG